MEYQWETLSRQEGKKQTARKDEEKKEREKGDAPPTSRPLENRARAAIKQQGKGGIPASCQQRAELQSIVVSHRCCDCPSLDRVATKS